MNCGESSENLPVELLPSARLDIENALHWYGAHSREIAEQFLVEVERTLVQIGAAPKLFPRANRSLRRSLVHRFPFQILYRLAAEKVEIVAVAHTSRQFGYWKSQTR